MDNLTGKTLKSYEICEQIGAGGFGAVYRAIQQPIGREVAIKVILPEFANKADFVRRFETEAQLVARLEHPHIVPLYDYWREPGGAYLVMRYLRGGSLRESLAQHGAWDAPRVAQMINQVAGALSFAHLQGVVHRDLKSDNIVIDLEGNCYLTDFGIAKHAGGSEDQAPDTIIGTPAYMAPELIQGATASPLSDVYAFGILAFEALTGSKPFTDDSPSTLLFRQLNDPLPQLWDFRDDLPDALDQVLGRATSKDPASRYDTPLAFARDFLDAVRTSQAGMPATRLTLEMRSITAVEEALFEPKNPYKGLRAFQQADADDFYGRGSLVEDLLMRLGRSGSDDDFLAVIGPSGSGKSSIVKAGLMPRIQQGALDQSLHWLTLEMVPGKHPIEELEAALITIATAEMPDLPAQLRADDRGLLKAIKRIVPDKTVCVLFIDQFEEVFTLVEDEDERRHFLDSLLQAAEDDRSHLKVIITMRADFYDRPLLYAGFGQLIRAHTELVLPLTDRELEEAIVRPAERAGMSLEPGLAQAIIADVLYQPGALPLLQYALTELFERRKHRLLTIDAYREIGGTSGALARRAEELYQSFSTDEHDATRQMFMRLVSFGDGGENTRRRVLQAELLSLESHDLAMQRVIAQFGKYRLLTFDHDPQTRASIVELAHEALIRQWERARTWLEENREALRLYRRLTAAATEWEQSRRDASFLARGTRLQQFDEWSRSSGIEMNQGERAFLDTSIQARSEREAEERAQQEREEHLRQQARNRLRAIAAISLIAALVGFVLAAIAVQARQQAETAAQIAAESEAEARGLALAANARNAFSEGDPQLALNLALAAKDAYSPAPVEVLRTLASVAYAPGPQRRFEEHSASVLAVAFSPDGQYAASGGIDGTLIVRAVSSGEVLLQLPHDDIWINSISFHPQGSQIALAFSDGSLQVVTLPEGDPLYQIQAHDGETLSVAYSPDGALLLSGGADHLIQLWDAASGDAVRTLEGHTGTVFRAVFSPDSTRIASSAGDATLLDDSSDEQDRTVRIWDAQSAELLLTITPRSGFVRSVAYSPDGSTIAAGMWDSANGGTVRLYDPQTGEELDRYFAHTTAGVSVSYSRDGLRLTSIAWDRTVRIWDVQRGVEITSYSGFPERVLAVDSSPNGEYLLLGSGNIGNNNYTGTDRAVDRSVWLWDLQSRDQIAALRDSTEWLWATDISQDGTLAAAGSGPLRLPQDAASAETLIRVWQIQSGEQIASFSAHTDTVDSVRFHPNGRLLLSAGWDARILLWDLVTGTQRRAYEGHEGRVYMVRFNQDGSQFASAGADGLVILWDTESGEQLRTFTHDTAVNAVDFSPDGTRLATSTGNFGTNDNAVRVWDLASGELLQTMTGHRSLVNEVRWHPDGQFLVSTSWDGTVRVWDSLTGTEVRQFSGHNGNTFGIDFSQDGSLMLTTSADKSVRLWDFATGEELHRYEQHSDWVQEVAFAPDDQTAISAAQDKTLRIWRVDRSVDELTAFASSTRTIRPLTCSERTVYRIGTCE